MHLVDNHNISVKQEFFSLIIIFYNNQDNVDYFSHKINPNYSYTLIITHKTFMNIKDLRFYYT